MAGLVGLLSLTLLVAVSAGGTFMLRPESFLVLPSWMAGPLGGIHIHLPAGALLPLFSLMFASYVLAVKHSARLSPRLVLGTIAALNAIVLLAPPLMSTDVFSYQAYARMFVSYGLNPYLHSPYPSIQLDHLYPFIGNKWINTPTVYGPVFTLLSGLVDKVTIGAGAYQSISASTLIYKVIASVSGLAVVAFLWHAAKLRGLNQVRAVAVFGLNPLVVIYGVGGGHNDLVMLALTTGALYALLAHRERSGGAAIALGAAVKLTGFLILPFAVLGSSGLGATRRRRLILLGAGLASAAVAVIGLSAFGLGQIDMLGSLQKIQSEGDASSIPGFLSIVLGLHFFGRVVGLILGGAFLTVCSWLLFRVWSGKMDWVDGAGWATVAMLVSASSMLPWYAAWLMPLIALCTSRRLWRTGLWLTGAFQLITMAGYVPH